MFAFSIETAKSNFFDRKTVTSRLSKAKRRAFNRVGALARKIARNSMRPISKSKLKQISKKRLEAGRILLRKRQTPAGQARFAKLQSEIRALQRSVHSKPGQPPKTIKGTIKKQLFYAYDSRAESVVVGPALFAPESGAPGTLEYGGMAQIGPHRVNIAARPYMGPARDKVMPQVAGFFRDSL